RAAHGGLEGSIMVSDAFFPFRDGADVGIREGVTGIVQPGGSIRDWEVIGACNESDVTMVFTGQRNFRH
ncbi:MAG: IMP cyclohydrolase, partial [Spirochaetia bacterium]